jgi:uncharacterized protein YjbI with pentapeptide repeats
MADYVRSRAGVGAWPDDPAARAALATYLDALGPDPLVVETRLEGGYLDFTGADLSGLEVNSASLMGAHLDDVRMAAANLTRASLSGADLRRAELTSAMLFRVEAAECDAREASFRDAGLVHADLTGADLRGADLRGADLTAAYLGRADLRGADLRGCVFGPLERPTALHQARLSDCQIAGASGYVAGSVDVSADEPRLLHGAELAAWFRSLGAIEVNVTSS